MTDYKGIEFANQQVRLNGNEFDGCMFKRCRLVFDAKGPLKVQRCGFEDVEFSMEGAAAETVTFLSGINKIKGVGDVYVQEIFRRITAD